MSQLFRISEFLLGFFVLFLPFLSPAMAADTSLSLTEEERNWIKEHPEITIAFDANYAPYSFQTKEGEFNGIAMDFAQELAQRAGLKLNPYPDGTWKGLYAAAQRRDIDVIATLVMRPERHEWFAFTEPYISLAQYIITRKGNEVIKRREEIAGKTVALVEKYSTTRYVLEEFPDVTPYYVDSLTEALEAVSIGKADATVAAMGMAQHLIAQKGLTNMRFAALYAQGLSEQRFGVRKDWPELVSILKKALTSLTGKERLKIYQNWSRPEVAIVETVIPKPVVNLTDSEHRWIKEHKEIRLGVDPEFAPFEFVDDEGRYQGMAADYIELINERLGLEMKPLVGLTWGEAVEKAQKREIDVLPIVGITEKRKQYFEFSKSYVGFPRVIITRQDSQVLSMEDLSDKKVAVQANSSHHGFINEETDIEPVLYDTFRKAMLALSQGDNDAVIGNLAVATHVIQNMSLANLKLPAHASPKIFPLVFAVRKDWPELVTLIDKALASLTEKEKGVIHQRWVPVQIETVKIELTEEEQAWLAEHPVIRVHNEKDWPPFNFYHNDQPAGYSIDYMNLIAKRLGITVEYISGPSWNEFMDMIRNKDLDVMLNIANTEERRENIHFTNGYFTALNGIYSKKSGQAITSLEQMIEEGLTMAVPKDFSNHKLLEKYYPEIKLVPKIDQMASIEAVLSGKADATIGREGVMNYLLTNRMIASLKMTGIVPGEQFRSAINIGVRKDWPVLRDIIQKAMQSITVDELITLRRKWALGGEESRGVDLTEKEFSWLKEHPVVRVGADPVWAPLEFRDESGAIKGISVDYLKRIQKMLGIEFEFVNKPTWSEMLEMAKHGKLDLLSSVKSTPSREQFLNFTDSYIEMPIVIFSGPELTFVGEPELHKLRVAVVKGYATEELLTKDYPDIDLVLAESTIEALHLLARNEVDVFVGNILTASYYLGQLGYTQIKVAGDTSYIYNQTMGVRKDWPILAGILQKTLDAIPPYEQNKIRQQWVTVKYEHGFDYSILWKVLIIVSIIFMLFIYWNRRLAKEINKRRQAEDRLLKHKDHLEDMVNSRTKALSLKTRDLEQVLYAGSHDLRTPLVNVQGYSGELGVSITELMSYIKYADVSEDILKKIESVFEEDISSSIQFIQDNISKMDSLLNSLIRISRTGKIEIKEEQVNMNQLVHGIANTFKTRIEEAEINIEVNILPECRGDKEQLNHVFLNLIGNAIKYIARNRRGTINVSGYKEEGRSIYCVEDNGIGIAPAHKEKIFEIFYQLDPVNYTGEGLGLTIVRNILDRMHGEIWIESEEGNGSKFFVSMPSWNQNQPLN